MKRFCTNDGTLILLSHVVTVERRGTKIVFGFGPIACYDHDTGCESWLHAVEDKYSTEAEATAAYMELLDIMDS